VPLLYVIRVTLVSESDDNDPPFGDETGSISQLTWR
jgi:hypothetical protein